MLVFWEIGFFRDKRESQAVCLELQEQGYVRYDSLPLETRDGKAAEVEFISNSYQENHRSVAQCNIRDISERSRMEIKLKQQTESLSATLVQMETLIAEKEGLLEEKGMLAAELQHRVRNNLQLVYGMLIRQIELADAEGGKEGIRAIARRDGTQVEQDAVKFFAFAQYFIAHAQFHVDSPAARQQNFREGENSLENGGERSRLP